MKKLISMLVCAFLIISCSISKKGADGKPGKDGVNAVPKITAQGVKASMEYLASDELEGRATGSDRN